MSMQRSRRLRVGKRQTSTAPDGGSTKNRLDSISPSDVQRPSSRAATGLISPFAIVWMFAVIVICLMLLANFSFGLLSSTRAYV
jgi:hypothetical protein